MKRNDKGFTMVELLIVVVIIGVVVAIAIPNLLNAIDRGKQKRSMADLRSIGNAVEAYNVENSIYPSATSISALADATTNVVPTYLKALPLTDGWHHDFYVNSTTVGYTLASGGKDGGDLSGVQWGPFHGMNFPIVFMNGQFFAWPEGVQE